MKGYAITAAIALLVIIADKKLGISSKLGA